MRLRKANKAHLGDPLPVPAEALAMRDALLREGFKVVEEEGVRWPGGTALVLRQRSTKMCVAVGCDRGLWGVEVGVKNCWTSPRTFLRALDDLPLEQHLEGFERATETILEIQSRVRAGSVDTDLVSRRLDAYAAEHTENYTDTYHRKRRVREARDAGQWDLVVAELETWESLDEHDAKLLRVARRRVASQ